MNVKPFSKLLPSVNPDKDVENLHNNASRKRFARFAQRNPFRIYFATLLFPSVKSIEVKPLIAQLQGREADQNLSSLFLPSLSRLGDRKQRPRYHAFLDTPLSDRKKL